jgi:hypothetical protein
MLGRYALWVEVVCPLFSARNLLSIVAAYYLAAWLVVPLRLQIDSLTGVRVYHPNTDLPLYEATDTIPILVSVFLAGAASGYFLRSPKPKVWVAAIGVIMASLVWSSTAWYVRPSTSVLLLEAGKALVAGVVGAGASWMVLRI